MNTHFFLGLKLSTLADTCALDVSGGFWWDYFAHHPSFNCCPFSELVMKSFPSGICVHEAISKNRVKRELPESLTLRGRKGVKLGATATKQ